MLVRSVIYLSVGLVLVVLASILNTRLGWNVDAAWLLVIAAAFAYPSEVAPIAGFACGIILDALTGTVGFYTISYGGFGAIVMLLRRTFYLDGLLPAWIIALVGAEALWLFLGVFARAVTLLGGSARIPPPLSPFLASTLIVFPFAYLFAKLLLRKPEEPGRVRSYGATTRIIDRT